MQHRQQIWRYMLFCNNSEIYCILSDLFKQLRSTSVPYSRNQTHYPRCKESNIVKSYCFFDYTITCSQLYLYDSCEKAIDHAKLNPSWIILFIITICCITSTVADQHCRLKFYSRISQPKPNISNAFSPSRMLDTVSPVSGNAFLVIARRIRLYS